MLHGTRFVLCIPCLWIPKFGMEHDPKMNCQHTLSHHPAPTFRIQYEYESYGLNRNTCKSDVYCKESKYYDQSSKAQRMLKGDVFVALSHLSIPFPLPSPMKGAYICCGCKTCKKYEFTRPKHGIEWHFLPINLDNVLLCEIEGKGTWPEKNSRAFHISSLVFIAIPEEYIAPERLSLLPWK
ncbi:hypothetical protein ADUPG1_000645 [Aduncisulcus paluster]|uniref:Uncharacterized protein n=1 Tax=Aduncisulcus paluster TaxID=2918883 RepID=A0ABQ5K791_9EUKA|nr:hypothetical protein ADUPG1_000645 [Aduncisulcus paluster]